MLKLLIDKPISHYPDEFLCARIQGRSGVLLDELTSRQDQPDLFAENGLENTNLAREERSYFFKLMNQPLRKKMAPFFFYFELDTILIVLREKEAGNQDMVETVLQGSLLSSSIKATLQKEEKLKNLLSFIESVFCPGQNSKTTLLAMYNKKDLGNCEKIIRRRFFREAMYSHHNYEVRRFLQDIIDVKNMLLAAKHLRWQMEGSADLIEGGKISVNQLSKALAKSDLLSLVNPWLSGINNVTTEMDPSILETVLFREMLLKLRRRSRQFTLITIFIHYIFSLVMANRNLRVLHYSSSRDRNRLEQVMIR